MILFVGVIVLPRHVGWWLVGSGEFFFLGINRLLLMALLALMLLTLLCKSKYRIKYSGVTRGTMVLIFMYFFFLALAIILNNFDYRSVNYLLNEGGVLGGVFFVVLYLWLVNYSADSIHYYEYSALIALTIIVLFGLIEVMFQNNLLRYIPEYMKEPLDSFDMLKYRAGFYRAQSVADNPIALTVLVAVLSPFVYLLYRARRCNSVGLMLLFISLLVVLVNTQSRVAWLLALTFLCISAIITRGSMRLFIVVFGAIASAITLGFLVLNSMSSILGISEFESRLTGRQATKSIDYRADFHRDAIPAWATKPLLGHGRGSFSQAVESATGRYYPHHESYYVTLLVEAGILSLVSFLFVNINIVVLIGKNYRRSKLRTGMADYRLLVVMSSLIIFQILFFVINVFNYTSLSILYWAMLAYSLALLSLRKTVPLYRSLMLDGDPKGDG